MFYVYSFVHFMSFCVFKAPSNMKAVLQAGWLFTVAIGNFIVLIVAELAKIPKQVKKKKKKSSLTKSDEIFLAHISSV